MREKTYKSVDDYLIRKAMELEHQREAVLTKLRRSPQNGALEREAMRLHGQAHDAWSLVRKMSTGEE